jgi:tetratricopeptide (TPR) repeat protein
MTESIAEQDSKKLNAAVETIVSGDFNTARRMLLEVVKNTPADYRFITEHPDGSLSIEFWNNQAFLQYVTFMTSKGPGRSIKSIRNVYPQAYYYLGFACVKAKQFDDAIAYLRRGIELEPQNPMFRFELAQALVQSGDPRGALELYESVNEVGLFVSAPMLAMSLRGRGFALIEMKRYDEAETVLRESLKHDPQSKVALGELQYIAHLRQGGSKASTTEVTSVDLNNKIDQCAICGRKITSGKVTNFKGRPVVICKQCLERPEKKWWQFWR